MYRKWLVMFAGLLPSLVQAASFDATSLGLLWGAPFALVLLSIALFPLFLPQIWHHHFGKITLLWSLLFLIPFTLSFGFHESLHLVVHALVAEYIPFILLLLALFTISGGILITGNLKGSPKLNTILLVIGTALASVMGTTGAAMLMIRPVLKANEHRQHKVHVVIFFIFLVANIGGGLTPLGDPPLFLGFLKGVSFGWTLMHMLTPVLISTIVLLIAFYFLDRHYFIQSNEIEAHEPLHHPEKLAIFGKWNFLLLAGVVAAVLMSGVWQPKHAGFDVLGTHYPLPNLVRDVIFVLLTLISLLITPKQVRAGNEFNWEPILEVAKLFAGIFITISPVLAMLQAGEKGAFARLIALVHNAAGEPINTMYFWMSGMLSAFLDNAPTYLVFFNMAGGNPQLLMTEQFHTLLAVSMGSVFMGALSYIGNAPNFMVKSIAEQRKVKMPSFFGYMMWSFGILVPLFILHTLIFFVLELF